MMISPPGILTPILTRMAPNRTMRASIIMVPGSESHRANIQLNPVSNSPALSERYTPSFAAHATCPSLIMFDQSHRDIARLK